MENLIDNHIAYIEEQILPLRKELQSHSLYQNLTNIDDIKIFMEQHVFPVWDFMSLLKGLQQRLTCTSIPWMPVRNPTTARFINEIVHGEESDLNELNEPKSHFEMYLDAMDQVGASTKQIQVFTKAINNDKSVSEAGTEAELLTSTQAFLNYTFDVLETDQAHKIASAFTFGREDVIPDMFIAIVKEAEKNTRKANYSKLTYYLERHIELDGDEHGPLSLKMIEELCGDDEKKWDEALVVAKESLQKRIDLWTAIEQSIQK